MVDISKVQTQIISKTNQQLLYWTGIEIDPESKRFKKDLSELVNIIFSIEMINGAGDINRCVDLTVKELTRKTIKNLIIELEYYKQQNARYTPISNIYNDEPIDSTVPVYTGVNLYPVETTYLQQRQKAQPPVVQQQVIAPVQQQVIAPAPAVQQVSKKKYSLNIDAENTTKIDNKFIYKFPDGMTDVFDINTDNIKFKNTFYNITEDNTKILVNEKEYFISEGYYKNITELLNEINSKLIDEKIIFEINKLNSKIRIKRGLITKSAILQKQYSSERTASASDTESSSGTSISMSSDLSQILGFDTYEMTLLSVLTAKALPKLFSIQELKVIVEADVLEEEFDESVHLIYSGNLPISSDLGEYTNVSLAKETCSISCENGRCIKSISVSFNLLVEDFNLLIHYSQ